MTLNLSAPLNKLLHDRLAEQLGVENATVVETVVREFPYNVLFAVVSGSHAYGFPSVNSDIDVRVVYALPLSSLIGLRVEREEVQRIEQVRTEEGTVTIDLSAMDIGKYVRLLYNGDGTATEWLYSPLVIAGEQAHTDLQKCLNGSANKSILRHYYGFAKSQVETYMGGKAGKEGGKAKNFLYALRLLLTGIAYGDNDGNIIEMDPCRALAYIQDPRVAAVRSSGNLSLERVLEHAVAMKSQDEGANAGIALPQTTDILGQLGAILEERIASSTLPNKPGDETFQKLNTYLVNVRNPPPMRPSWTSIGQTWTQGGTAKLRSAEYIVND